MPELALALARYSTSWDTTMGLKEGVRGRRIVTTNPDAARPCPDDKVNRQFKAERPNQLWVSDFTPAFAGAGSMYQPGPARSTRRS